MQFGLINSLASWWFRKRLADLHLFAINPVDTQEGQLSMLIERAKYTQFGKEYDFQKIKSIAHFQIHVPLQNYHSLLPYIEKMLNGEPNILWDDKIRWFAKSSGTSSGKSKFIPVSEEGLELNHFQAGKDVIAYYLNNYPDSQLLKGKTLKLGGSKELLKFDEAYVGDLSAIMIDNMPFWSNLITIPEKKTALLSNWEIKIDRILDEAFPAQLVGLAGVPSWMMLLLKEAIKKSKKSNVLEIWPDLEVFFHGGVSFLPYKKAYQELFPSKDFHYMEIYNASEGFFALQDKKDSDELLLLLNHGIFYEFIPMNSYDGVHTKTVLPLKKVEKDINYAMVISTNSGLWRYIIGDTVKFTSVKPYRIKITGRTKHFINVFGEEVIIENTDKAIENACNQTNCSVSDYTVAPIFMGTDKKGAHEWLLDFPVIHQARKGLFYDWLKQKNKLGGQNKIPRLSNSRSFIEELLMMK